MPSLVSPRQEITLTDFIANPNWQAIDIFKNLTQLKNGHSYTLFWRPTIKTYTPGTGILNSWIKCEFYYYATNEPFTISSTTILQRGFPGVTIFSVSVNEENTKNRLFLNFTYLNAEQIETIDLANTDTYSKNFWLFERSSQGEM